MNKELTEKINEGMDAGLCLRDAQEYAFYRIYDGMSSTEAYKKIIDDIARQV